MKVLKALGVLVILFVSTADGSNSKAGKRRLKRVRDDSPTTETNNGHSSEDRRSRRRSSSRVSELGDAKTRQQEERSAATQHGMEVMRSDRQRRRDGKSLLDYSEEADEAAAPDSNNHPRRKRIKEDDEEVVMMDETSDIDLSSAFPNSIPRLVSSSSEEASASRDEEVSSSSVCEAVENALLSSTWYDDDDASVDTTLLIEEAGIIVDSSEYYVFDENDIVATVIRNEGGGNCLFHSIQASLHSLGIDVSSADLRQDVMVHAFTNLDETLIGGSDGDWTIRRWIEHFISNPDGLSGDFIDDPMSSANSVEEFLSLMGEDGTYMGDMALFLVNDFLMERHRLTLDVSLLDDGLNLRHAHRYSQSGYDNVVSVVYNGHSHYESLSRDDPFYANVLDDSFSLFFGSSDQADVLDNDNSVIASSASLQSSSASASPALPQLSGYRDLTDDDHELIFRLRTTKPKAVSYDKIAAKIGRGCTGSMIKSCLKYNDELSARIDAARDPVPSDLSVARRDEHGDIIPIINGSNYRVWTTEEDNMIIDAWNSGDHLAVIAHRLKASESEVDKRVRTVLRDRLDLSLLGTNREVRQPFTPAEIEDITDQYNDGVPRSTIAAQFNCSLNMLRSVLGMYDCVSKGCTRRACMAGYCSQCMKIFDINAYNKFCERVSSYVNWKYAHDMGYRVKCLLRNRLSKIIKKLGNPAVKGKTQAVSCSSRQLGGYLKLQQTGSKSWMTLANHGKLTSGRMTWQVDHIYPIGPYIAEFLTLLGFEEMMKRINHWSNLSPLESRENSDKGVDIPEGFYWDVKQGRWLWKQGYGTNYDLPEEDEEED
eukprot:scaffold22387_cov78-Skeletonema_dohrnii-CCMP3373.AAC.2